MFENCTGKICYDVKNNGFTVHDVKVKLPWRHVSHINSCSRNYETIDLSYQPMKFPEFYLQYDNDIYNNENRYPSK